MDLTEITPLLEDIRLCSIAMVVIVFIGTAANLVINLRKKKSEMATHVKIEKDGKVTYDSKM